MKLLSATAAVILATATLATAAPQPRASGSAATATTSKAAKKARPVKRSAAKSGYRKTTSVRKTTAVQTTAARPTPVRTEGRKFAAPAPVIVRERTHDVQAEELAIKRQKSNVKAAEKSRDWPRVARERRAMYQMEADLRADKADSKDRQRATRNAAKKSRIPFWGWWR